MNDSNDKCKQLRDLYDRIEAEVRVLKESEQEEEREGVANPVEMASIIKSLQKTLSEVDLDELQKCLDSN
ncbi:MAG: hypothetical protein E6J31_05750 [Chloroflexi bacterium]|nr:MAG: hypothetical protein E6J31_05750 [Chloroflexota bacterium]